jgi:predicted peptidase
MHNTIKQELSPMHNLRALVGCVVLLAALAGGCGNADPSKKLNASMPKGTGFILREVKTDAGNQKYSVFIPRDYKPGVPYPTIIFLHGIGEAGSDGVNCTTVGIGPAIAKRNGNFPFIVLFPQVGWDWTTKAAGDEVLDVLADAQKQYSIDSDRVTLTGMSSGGKGVWVLGARYSNKWNALVPMGGFAAVDAVPALAKSRIPIWALHNSGDFVVPSGGTKTMLKKLQEAGANPRSTIYDAGGHNCWDAAYDEGELFVWLQQQRASARGGGTAARSAAGVGTAASVGTKGK